MCGAAVSYFPPVYIIPVSSAVAVQSASLFSASQRDRQHMNSLKQLAAPAAGQHQPGYVYEQVVLAVCTDHSDEAAGAIQSSAVWRLREARLQTLSYGTAHSTMGIRRLFCRRPGPRAPGSAAHAPGHRGGEGRWSARRMAPT